MNYSGYSNIVKVVKSTLLYGLVDYWKFDEVSGDATGINGNVLTNNNTVTYAPGKINNAASLGSDNVDKSLTKDSAFGMTYQSSRSIAGWFNVNTAPALNTQDTFAGILFATNPGNHSIITYKDANGFKSLAIYVGVYGVTLVPGEWNHIAITFDYAGNVYKLYLNGILRITTTAYSGNYSAYVNRFSIGTNANGSFGSMIADEVGLWDRILTESEIVESSMGNAYPFTAYINEDSILDKVAYCWFNSPRAIYNSTANKTWIGIVHNDGTGYSQHILTVDNDTGVVSTVKVGSVVEFDDHNEASVLVRSSDNKLFIAYTEHALTVGIRFRLSTNALDASAWEAEGIVDPGEAGSSYTYVNAFEVTNGDIYIFFRDTAGGDAWWNFIKSTDGGATFGDDTRVIHKPYVRCWQNPANKDIIHFAASHHPNELTATPKVTHVYFDASDETWHKSDGTDVTASIPLVDANMTTIFSNTDPNQGWIEDLFLDSNGYPRVLMTYYPNIDTTPQLKYLYYSEWTGAAWSTPYEIHQSINRNIGTITIVNTYPPLASFDRANANRIFASKDIDGVCEIFELTRVAANNFTVVQKTFNSIFDQWRPFTAASPNRNVFWLNKIRYYHYMNDFNQQLICKTFET